MHTCVSFLWTAIVLAAKYIWNIFKWPLCCCIHKKRLKLQKWCKIIFYSKNYENKMKMNENAELENEEREWKWTEKKFFENESAIC